MCWRVAVAFSSSAEFLSSVFKLLPEDPVEIVHLFLSTLREKVCLLLMM